VLGPASRTLPDVRSVLLLALLVGCNSNLADVGDPCRNTASCVSGTVCFPTRSGGNRCMAECASEETLCEDGSVCLEASSGVRVCFTGGDLGVGEVCTGGDDCQTGARCVLDSESGVATCETACDVRTPSCPSGTSCRALEGDPIGGYCTVD